MPSPRSWDVYCRVVDNYGDAAVCWRLARALAVAGGARTRLWIDDLAVLHALQPQVAIDSASQFVAGVEVRRWAGRSDDTGFGEPADVVVDAFGCGLPEAYVQAMAARTPRPLWIVLEYLSAEPWVAAHHGLPSPHPRLPLERYFYFPGFGAGGLLREADLDARRAAFLQQPSRRDALWRDAGFSAPGPGDAVISLFGYETPAVAELLEAWASGGGPVVAAVPQSRLSADVAAYFGSATPSAGKALSRGALEARFLPFLQQERYDELLWASDWNFVRGEDSFVRAQWAERPFVWHIYPQSGEAHLGKLEAFLERYCTGLAPDLAGPLQALWRGWNGAAKPGVMGAAWEQLCGQQAALRAHAQRWARQAAESGDLAINLAKFCLERLK